MLTYSFKLIINRIVLLRCLLLELLEKCCELYRFWWVYSQRCLDPLAACFGVMTLVAEVRLASSVSYRRIERYKSEPFTSRFGTVV
jgi:hypothetical protein